ncbi:MAG: hypothetical protein KAH20_06130 [Methylococcales bacterium]|nr:hypothetical protein [Methylococcales bacterium]
MIKSIPIELQEHILPFNWDVTLVWALSTPTQEVYREEFDYFLTLPLWSSTPNFGMLFDVSPIEVIKSPDRFPHEYRRILQADTKFPIELLEYNHKNWILDGVHRLVKMYLKDNKIINIRIHPSDVIPRVKII